MKRFFKTVCIVVFGITALLILFHVFYCPILQYPKPTGQYSVGSRAGFFSCDGAKKFHSVVNGFPVTIFYPKQGHTPGVTFSVPQLQILKEELQRGCFLNKFFWNCLLSGVYSHVQLDAPIMHEPKQFPIIIYLPGIGSENVDVLYPSELASHGYIVCCIQTPGDVRITEFADGTRIGLNHVLEDAVRRNDRTMIYEYRNHAHLRWSSYIEYTLEHLKEEQNNQDSWLYQKIDFSKLAVMGHSHGGAVALDFCQKHIECKAGVNLDGWTKTYNSTATFKTPFLMMLSEHGSMPEMQPLFENNQRSDFEKVVIKDSGHGSFSDRILIKWPLSPWNASAIRLEITQKLVSFFDQYLKG